MNKPWMMLWIVLLAAFGQAKVPDACTLLTQPEAEAVMGMKGSKVIKDTNGYQSLCAYQVENPSANSAARIQVDLYVGPIKAGGQTLDGKAMFAQALVLERQLPGFKSAPLPGIGDEAVQFQVTLKPSDLKLKLEALGNVTVYSLGIVTRKGDQVLAMQLAGTQMPKLETLKPLVQRALSRLP